MFFGGLVSVKLRKDGPAPVHTLAAPNGFPGLLRKEEEEQKTRIRTREGKCSSKWEGGNRETDLVKTA